MFSKKSKDEQESCIFVANITEVLKNVDISDTEKQIHELAKFIPELQQLSEQLNLKKVGGEVKQKMLDAYKPIVNSIKEKETKKHSEICSKFLDKKGLDTEQKKEYIKKIKK